MFFTMSFFCFNPCAPLSSCMALTVAQQGDGFVCEALDAFVTYW